jgi:SAM-dependent methyltransferase
MNARQLRMTVRDQVCRHVDGIAIGSTMAALWQHGATELIAEAQPISAATLRRATTANPGFLHVAIRLLADQGWVTTTGTPGTDEFTIAPTVAGRTVLTGPAEAYRHAIPLLVLAQRLEDTLFGQGTDRSAEAELASAANLMRHEWQLPRAVPVAARQQVITHLDGHLAAPLVTALARHEAFGPGGLLRVDRDLPGMVDALRVLTHLGWLRDDSGQPGLTPAGSVALRYARQYWYPMTYLPTLRRVPELLFGDARRPWAAAGDTAEPQVQRRLDIQFSGEVFTATCRSPFLELTLPLFDGHPVAEQASLVVDAGCGDGTLLETLYREVAANTTRGRQLARHPLLMVGVEPSPVARRTAAARLHAAGVPHLIIDGDIADPQDLVKRLRTHRLDAFDALHVSKSVIHDRAYEEPATMDPATPAPPPSSCAFALPDGAAIPADRMALNLAGFFRRWRPLARRRGLMVIEAHTATPHTITGLLGRAPTTALDATHGYSCQYPVEPEVFAWAADAAGFRSRAHRDLGETTVGHTILTVDHFVADPDSD